MTASTRSQTMAASHWRIVLVAITGIIVLVAVARLASAYIVPAALIVGALIVFESWRQLSAQRRSGSIRERTSMASGRFAFVVSGVVLLVALVLVALTAGT